MGVPPPDNINFSDLTLRQRRFIDEYLVTGNKMQSALRAGYSPRSVHTLAYNEFNQHRVQAYYQHRIQKIAEASQENVARLLHRLEEIAFADMRDYVDKEGNLKPVDDKINGRNISAIRHTKSGVDISLLDQQKAIETLGKFYKMWSDKLEISGDKSAPLNITFEGVLPGDPRIKTAGESKADTVS